MIPIEKIKIGGTERHTRIYNLIIKVWEEEKTPKVWNTSLYCHIHKKGDKTLCINYEAIALLEVAYKVFQKNISKRLEPYVEDIVRNYQAGSRRNKSRTDRSLP
jgi:hypothetical protein